MDDELPIPNITVRVALPFGILAIIVGIVSDQTIFANHGRIIAFAVFVSSIAIYSSYQLTKARGIFVFLSMYILLHVVLCFIAPPDDSYYGVILIPAAMADYAVFIFLVYFFCGRQSRVSKDN